MKTLVFITLAFVATVCAYEIEDIPDFMKDRLDHFIELTRKWEEKWQEMSKADREFFERMIYDRLSYIPENVKLKIHEKVENLDPEDQVKLREYLFQRFPELNSFVDVEKDSVTVQITKITDALPEMVREKISDFIAIRFAPAAAYQISDADFIDFPDIPELIEVPAQGEGVPYSEDGLDAELRQKVDDFLLQRENWKRRWENLPAEKREAFEKYVKSEMSKLNSKE